LKYKANCSAITNVNTGYLTIGNYPILFKNRRVINVLLRNCLLGLYYAGPYLTTALPTPMFIIKRTTNLMFKLS